MCVVETLGQTVTVEGQAVVGYIAVVQTGAMAVRSIMAVSCSVTMAVQVSRVATAMT